jgi:hypothetical protein
MMFIELGNLLSREEALIVLVKQRLENEKFESFRLLSRSAHLFPTKLKEPGRKCMGKSTFMLMQ